MSGGLTGDGLTLVSYWRVDNNHAAIRWSSLRIFVHLLDGEGRVVAQHDGLDVRLEGLQAGDEVAQLHRLPVSAELVPGPYALQIGLYEPETNTRLTVLTPSGPVDRILLHSFVFNVP
jgi:hypothetical protein